MVCALASSLTLFAVLALALINGACCDIRAAESPSLNLLVVYANDGTGSISSLAGAVAAGASSAGASTKILTAVAANYKRSVAPRCNLLV